MDMRSVTSSPSYDCVSHPLKTEDIRSVFGAPMSQLALGQPKARVGPDPSAESYWPARGPIDDSRSQTVHLSPDQNV